MAVLTAHEDPEMLPWLLGIANGKPNPSGDFLRSLADAALRADSMNYPILRPTLQLIRDKYPQYNDPEAETAMSAPKAAIVLTFKGLLAHYLWQQFPADTDDDIDLRAAGMIRTCNPQGTLEETAWREALAAAARNRAGK